MVHIKIFNNGYLILYSLVVIAIIGLLPFNVNAQLFNSGQEKTNDVYNPIPKSKPQPAQTYDSGNSHSNTSATKGKSQSKEAVKNSTKETNAAQSSSKSEMNSAVLGHVKTVTLSCVKKWEGQSCMKALSSMNMTFTSTYAATLQNANKKPYMDRLKNGCAASTAALKVVVPAYAMRSAMVECVNVMSDIADKTSVRPDPSLSQLSVGAVFCLGKDKSCKTIEQGLLVAIQGK